MLVTPPHLFTQYLAVFSAFRVYALWYTSRFKYLFFAAIIILGCVPIASNIVSYYIEDTPFHLMPGSYIQLVWVATSGSYYSYNGSHGCTINMDRSDWIVDGMHV